MSSRTSRYFGQSKGMGAERADCGPRGRSARSPPHTSCREQGLGRPSRDWRGVSRALLGAKILASPGL